MTLSNIEITNLWQYFVKTLIINQTGVNSLRPQATRNKNTIMVDTYLTRQTLLSRLKTKSDEQSWEDFVFYYGNFIHSIIGKMGVNSSESDDLSQQIILKIWNSIDKFDYTQKKGGFRNWIYTITKNTVLTQISHDKNCAKKTEAIIEDSFGIFSMPEIDGVISEEWNKHISTLAFENISKKVSVQAMEAFISGFRKEAVGVTATRLGLNEKTIYIYRHRIKNKLKAEISNLKEMLE